MLRRTAPTPTVRPPAETLARPRPLVAPSAAAAASRHPSSSLFGAPVRVSAAPAATQAVVTERCLSAVAQVSSLRQQTRSSWSSSLSLQPAGPFSLPSSSLAMHGTLLVPASLWTSDARARLALPSRASSARSYSVATAVAAATASQEDENDFDITESLYFVDRDDEAYQVAVVNLKNQTAGKAHRTLVVAAQMFGAGKTELGKNAVARAALQRHRLKAFPADVVEAYLGAVTVSFRLDEYQPEDGQTFAKYIASVLRDAITETARENPSEEWAQKALAIHWSKVPLKAKAVVSAFQASTGRGLFLHFDEVGALEGDEWKAMLLPPPSNDTDLQKRLRVYYAFWQSLVPLLSMKRVYMFLSGKAPGFPLVGMGMLAKAQVRPVVSPSRIHHVVLGPLSASNIDETLRSSVTRNGTRLEERITFKSKEWRERFLVRLEEETAGQPRLVHYFLEGMSVQRAHVNSEEALQEALQVGQSHAESKLMLSTNYTPNGAMELFYALLLLSALDVPLSAATMVAYHGSDKPLLWLVDKFNLYVVPDTRARVHDKDATWLRIRVARCLLKMLPQNAKSLAMARTMPPFLLEQVSSRLQTSVLGQGEPLEWLVRVRLALIMALAGSEEARRTWAEAVPAFASSAIGREIVTQVDGEPVMLPKVVTSKRSRCRAGTKFGEKMHVDKLPALLAGLPTHRVGYVSDKSASPDILLRLNSRLLCFALKFYSESSTATWAVINKEIGKSAHLHSEELPVTLVIVATNLGEEVREQMEPGALAWQVTRGTDARLEVPAGMEVLVLSDTDGLASLLGKPALGALRKLLRDRADPKKLAAEIDVAAQLLTHTPAFDLASFLSDEAKIKPENASKYLPLLKDVDEARLHLLTEAMLLKWGIEADLDRASILEAAKRRTSDRKD